MIPVGDTSAAAIIISIAATTIVGMLQYGPVRKPQSANGFVSKAVCTEREARFTERVAGVETRLANMERKIDKGFERIHERLDALVGGDRQDR
ncbi:hypothetical protein LCGC14_2745620 [marine sediment metagenome]|uniref:Uncharacterized protein n=1 Tax=marine sediment metagenome TaxID=412755 RepID=A0A0F8ZQB2_9ZZZZ